VSQKVSHDFGPIFNSSLFHFAERQLFGGRQPPLCESPPSRFSKLISVAFETLLLGQTADSLVWPGGLQWPFDHSNMVAFMRSRLPGRSDQLTLTNTVEMAFESSTA
jgi:hypothetical protein